MNVVTIREEIKKIASNERAQGLARFFKTGKGEYGEGDQFIGLTVPQIRKIASVGKDLPWSDLEQLLRSPIHEERLLALILLVNNFKKGDQEKKKDIYRYYLKNTKYINNWDLVDLSAGYIIGGYLFSHPEKMQVLVELARSTSIWERRIAIIATFEFIRNGRSDVTLRIADLLLSDKHDLIQKAVGWMLREVGKRCSEQVEEEYLCTRYQTMPRTMLRYAIERFPETKRKQYLAGTI